MLRARAIALSLVASCIAIGAGPDRHAEAFVTTDIVGPAGSHEFGRQVLVLPNGNIVVTDPRADSPTVADVGAVHLYSGATHQLISSLYGSKDDDLVGAGFLIEVGPTNFLVTSPGWDNGPAVDSGAVTFVDGTTGLSGVVSAANSLIGSTTGDQLGFEVTVLPNRNYVVHGAVWDNAGVVNAGSATWGSGTVGVKGPISAANSLVGTSTDDLVGLRVVPLTNSNYVVGSSNWTNTAMAAARAGAATWGDGTTGAKGAVSPANSLVGIEPDNFVGSTVVALTNGNYVVGSPSWSLGMANPKVGAATWRPGTSAAPDTVKVGNSLIGAKAGDQLGFPIIALTDGNYVVGSPMADNGVLVDVGAATWSNGSSGAASAQGILTGQSSLRGTTNGDRVGEELFPLQNGHYVVGSWHWVNGAIADAGAATFMAGGGQVASTVTVANSIVGSHAMDMVGRFIEVLSNGNYVVHSSQWDNGAMTDAGAATWGNGSIGTTGVVGPSISLVGGKANDFVGIEVLTLTNGNYVIRSGFGVPGQPFAGAATWRPGTSPSPAVVSAANSLIGSQQNDNVGEYMVALPTGDYIVGSPGWANGSAKVAGAATWGSGTSGIVGTVGSANSLVGTTANSFLGIDVTVFDDGSSAIVTDSFDNGPLPNVGAVTISSPSGLTGLVDPSNSFVGQTAEGGFGFNVSERRTASGQYVIGRPKENRVSFITLSDFTPLSPARLADTRALSVTVDGLHAGGGPLTAGATLELAVAGRGGVAASAVAVALNVTAVDALGNGFVTVFPCGSPRPTASNLNFVTGSIVPNAVLARIGAGGKVCLFVSQPTHLVVDVNGFFPFSSLYESVNPARVLDTRPGEPTSDGLQQGGGPAAAGAVTEVQITGRATVPADATGVALNVTVTEAAADAFVTVFPCGTPRPTASSLNVVRGGTIANLVVSKIGSGGRVCIFTQNTTHLVANVNGFFPAGSTYEALVPARLLETRPGLVTADGQFNGVGLRGAGTVTELKVVGRGGVPAEATTVVLNVTVDQPAIDGFVTVFPCGIGPPLASNLNYRIGQTVPNAVLVKVGTGGNVCLLNSQPTHIVADVVGYFPG